MSQTMEQIWAEATGEFYDSTRPQLIPGGASAALYFDGDFAAPPSIATRFGRVRWITVVGNAADCGIADYEPGNPVYDNPGALHQWVGDRFELGHRARVYVDRANAAAALNVLGGLAHDERCEFWIGTLDGIPLTAADLAQQLAVHWDAPIPAGQLWANQVWGGPAATVDKSLLYGAW